MEGLAMGNGEMSIPVRKSIDTDIPLSIKNSYYPKKYNGWSVMFIASSLRWAASHAQFKMGSVEVIDKNWWRKKNNVNYSIWVRILADKEKDKKTIFTVHKTNLWGN